MRVTGIFTGTTDSLSPLWRQCPDRYAIRAGRNLPDKEFRYLRTVIVTAAVYRGFNSELRWPEGPLTLPLNLPAPGRRQTLYVVFDLAESCVFSKQSPGPFHCDPRQLRGQASSPPVAHLLPKLRCQFAEFLHRGSLKRLGILSPSTCVRLRYGRSALCLGVFPGSMESTTLRAEALGITSQRYGAADFPPAPAYTLQPTLPIVGSSILLRHPIVITRAERYRNVDLFPIDYAFQPRLRGRLTLSGLAFLRKP